MRAKQVPAIWSCPNRYENIQEHREAIHPEEWSEYNVLGNDDDRNELFQTDIKVPFANAMRAHLAAPSSGDPPFVFQTDAYIVDMLISKMIYYNRNDEDDDDGVAEAAVGDADALDAVMRAKRFKQLRAKERAS